MFVSGSRQHEHCNLKVVLPCGSWQPTIEAWGAAVAEPAWLPEAATGVVTSPEDLAVLLSELSMCRPCSCLQTRSVHGPSLAEMEQVGSLPSGTKHIMDAGSVDLWRAAGCEVLVSGMSLLGDCCGACRKLRTSSGNHRHRQKTKGDPAPGDEPVGMTTARMVKLCEVRENLLDVVISLS